MKAIHNVYDNNLKSKKTVFNTSKIQNESNSQRQGTTRKISTHCVQYVKDTK